MKQFVARASPLKNVHHGIGVSRNICANWSEKLLDERAASFGANGNYLFAKYCKKPARVIRHLDVVLLAK